MKKAIIIIISILLLFQIAFLVLNKSITSKADIEVQDIFSGSYLILDLSRSYPERNDFSFDFFTDMNKKPLAFYKLIQAVKYAKNDDDIEAMIIYGSGNSLNRAQVDELYEALDEFSNEKKIYGFAEYLTLGNAVLLSHCDSLFLPEAGNIIMPGLSIKPMFYKGLFDKIGVGFDVIQHGKFKGGMENFTQKEFSEPFAKSIDALLDDFYNFYETKITKGRGLPDYKFDTLLSKALIYGDDVLKSGLVDGFMYKNQLDSLIKAKINDKNPDIDDDDDDFKIAIKKYYSSIKDKLGYSDGKIALIIAEGSIRSGRAKNSPFGNQEGIFATTLSEQIDKAADDDDIDAIVMRVNSGGGSALASDIIWNSVVRAKNKKPFIVSMAGAAASGGYYIAMAADSIFASDVTLTGSIGVYGAKLYAGELMEKGGITQQKFQRGKYAGLYNSLDRPWNEEETEIMQASIDHTYLQFITKAAKGRGMELDMMDSVARGRIWSGKDAKDKGLVDRNGGLWDAVLSAQKMAGLSESGYPEIELFPKQMSIFEFLSDIEGQTASIFMPKIYESFKNVSGDFSEIAEDTELLFQFNAGEPLYICPIRITGENPIRN